MPERSHCYKLYNTFSLFSPNLMANMHTWARVRRWARPKLGVLPMYANMVSYRDTSELLEHFSY